MNNQIIERLALNLRAYAWSRGAPQKDDDEEAAFQSASEIIEAIGSINSVPEVFAKTLDDLTQLCTSAIDSVSSAEGEADWNIPTFGPTTSESMKEELEELHEPLADLFIFLSGKRQHWSDCATSSAPAYLPRPCNCPTPSQDRECVA